MKRERKPRTSSVHRPVTYDTVREMARELPGTVEGTAYGTPALRVGKKLFARKHPDGESLVIRIEIEERAMRMRAEPETFHITDHYLNYPWMLVRLSTVDPEDLRELLQDAWRQSAPKLLIREFENTSTPNRQAVSRKPRGR